LHSRHTRRSVLSTGKTTLRLVLEYEMTMQFTSDIMLDMKA
jgi:hypothetical protein